MERLRVFQKQRRQVSLVCSREETAQLCYYRTCPSSVCIGNNEGRDFKDKFVLISHRAASLRRLLHASVWHRDPGHGSGDGRQDFNRHLFWRQHNIVRHLFHAQFVHSDACLLRPVCPCMCSNNVGPGFQLRIELYSSCVVEDFSLGAFGSMRGSRLGSSLGCSSGKKSRAATVIGSISSGENTVPPLSLTLWEWWVSLKYSLKENILLLSIT